MIQELISTSLPRCLNGNPGFGIAAQTFGMASNVSQAVHALGGYTHIAEPGNGKNPVIFLHAVRRSGGMERHIVSRIADCGNDYSGRTNRIAHHWIIEEGDLPNLPGGPAEIAAQNIFRSHWNEPAAELQPKRLAAAEVSPQKCTGWEQLTGDSGWGGIVAERAEKGDPISIIFVPEQNGQMLQTLIGEALTILPAAVRWKVTFSTYFIKSQESSGDKIQIKCFLADSEESAFVRQSPNTLVIDLRQHKPCPPGKYVEIARKSGKPKTTVSAAPTAVPLPIAEQGTEVPGVFEIKEEKPTIEIISESGRNSRTYSKGNYNDNWNNDTSSVRDPYWPYYAAGIVCILLLGFILFMFFGQKTSSDKKAMLQQETIKHLTKLNQILETDKQNLEEIIKTLEDNKKQIETTIQCNKTKHAEVVKTLEKSNNELQNKVKELEELAAAQQRKDEEGKQQKENKKLSEQWANLPKIWQGLRYDNDKIMVLENSQFLYNIKKTITLEYVQYIKSSDVISEQIDQKISFKRVKDNGGLIAEIKITPEGLQLQWADIKRGRDDIGQPEQEQYRTKILSANLRIKTNDRTLEIPLWTPLKFDDKIDNKLEVLTEADKIELNDHSGTETFKTIFTALCNQSEPFPDVQEEFNSLIRFADDFQEKSFNLTKHYSDSQRLDELRKANSPTLEQQEERKRLESNESKTKQNINSSKNGLYKDVKEQIAVLKNLSDRFRSEQLRPLFDEVDLHKTLQYTQDRLNEVSNLIEKFPEQNYLPDISDVKLRIETLKFNLDRFYKSPFYKLPKTKNRLQRLDSAARIASELSQIKHSGIDILNQAEIYLVHPDNPEEKLLLMKQ